MAALLACLLVPAPAQAGEAIVGLGNSGTRLVTFDSDAPGASFTKTGIPLRKVVDRAGVASLEPIDVPLKGIDYDPASGSLYGIGSDARIYTVETTVGIVTPVGDGSSVDPRLANSSADFGFDISPGGGSARVVDTADNSARYDLTAGTVVTPFDGVLSPPGGRLSALAYDDGADLFGIAAESNALVRIADDGTVTERGELGISETDSPTALDILGSSAFATATRSGEPFSRLTSIDLQTGEARPDPPPIASGAPLSGLAIAPGGSIQFRNTSVLGAESSRFVDLVVDRTGGDLRPTSVLYSTFDGGARAGEDYVQAKGGRVDFQAGQTVGLIRIPIVDDRLSERFELFGVALAFPAANAILASQRVAAVTIVSNDEGKTGPPQASFDSVRKLRPGSRAARFNFVCSEPCGVRTDLKLGRRIIGSGEAVGGTSPRPLNVRFTRAGARVLRGAKPKDRLRLVARVTDRQGQRKIVTTRVPLS